MPPLGSGKYKDHLPRPMGEGCGEGTLLIFPALTKYFLSTLLLLL